MVCWGQVRDAPTDHLRSLSDRGGRGELFEEIALFSQLHKGGEPFTGGLGEIGEGHVLSELDRAIGVEERGRTFALQNLIKLRYQRHVVDPAGFWDRRNTMSGRPWRASTTRRVSPSVAVHPAGAALHR